MSASLETATTGPPTAARARGRTGGFLPGFDGLRAIAALLVVVVHTGIASGFSFRHPAPGQYFARGEIGVSIFFLISGFLLYRPFVRASFEDRPGPAVGRFLLRRALRIVPLYWVALAATMAFTVSKVHGVGQTLAIACFLQVYSSQWILHGVTQAWTLCIEVTFYLALPLWAAAMRLTSRGRARDPRAVLRRELVALAILYGASLLFRWWIGADRPGPVQTAREWIPAWSDHFALGMGLAALSAYVAQTQAMPRVLRWTSRRGADLGCWVAAGVVYWAAATRIGLSKNPIATEPVGTDLAKQVLYGLFALLVLLPAVVGPAGHGVVRRLLTTRVLSLVGLVSYGLYLWHQFVIAQLQKAVGSWHVLDSPYPQFAGVVLGVAVAVSALTYVVIERPAIALGHRRPRMIRRREKAALHEPASS